MLCVKIMKYERIDNVFTECECACCCRGFGKIQKPTN